MKDSHFCKEFRYCPMRLDMENSDNKLGFLKENWPDLYSTDKINAMSMKNLKCSICVLEIAIDALAKEEFYCPYREVIRLVNTQTIIINTFELRKLQNELKQELEKLNKAGSKKSSGEAAI